MMEKKNIKYFAAACFVIPLVASIIDCFEFFYFLGLLNAISWILIIVALLTEKPILSAIGFAIRALVRLHYIAVWIKPVIDGLLPFSSLLWDIASLAVIVFLLIASINLKSAKTLSIIATMIHTLTFFIDVIICIINEYPYSATSFLQKIILIAGYMLLGLAFDKLSDRKTTVKTAITQNNNAPAQGTIEDDNVEKIMRLKSFLDDGVITQEEFDAKKKQLLEL